MDPTSLETKGDPFEESDRGKLKPIHESWNPGSLNNRNRSKDRVENPIKNLWMIDLIVGRWLYGFPN